MRTDINQPMGESEIVNSHFSLICHPVSLMYERGGNFFYNIRGMTYEKARPCKNRVTRVPRVFRLHLLNIFANKKDRIITWEYR